MAPPSDAWDDDDLDDLADQEFAELEHNAIQFTQGQSRHDQVYGNGRERGYGNGANDGRGQVDLSVESWGDEEFDDDDLEREGVGKVEVERGVQRGRREIGIGEVDAREGFRRERYAGATTASSANNHIVTKENGIATIPKPNGALHAQQNPPTLAYDPSALDALQRQVQTLLQAQETFRSELSAKAGEIAIVRSKSEKTVKEYERELTTLKKLNAERVATQQKEIEKAREAERKLATELEFVKKDLGEEVERGRLRRGVEKEKDGGREGGGKVTTPKKKVLADGFEDDEVVIISPSRFRGRRNADSPSKAGTKRKRKGQESPVKTGHLDVMGEGADDGENGVGTGESAKLLVERLKVDDDRLRFLESILAYCPTGCKHKILEELAHISLPSTPEESFASFVLQKLPTAQQPSNEFSLQLCEIFVSLWRMCLAEKFYKPIALLVSVLTHAIELKTMALSPYIIDTLLPIAQSTIDVIAIPRFKRETSPSNALIEIFPTLQLIHLLGSGCMAHRSDTRRFWRLMRMDFFLMMLSLNQSIHHLHLILQLLTMSLLKESIGPLDARAPDKNANFLLDRITYMFINEPYIPPPPPSDYYIPPSDIYARSNALPKPKFPRAETSKLRIQALHVLSIFTQTPWGRETIARHPHAIARLFHLLSASIESAYDLLPDHALSITTINLTIRNLHTLLLHTPGVNVDLPARLAPYTQGGTQKHILALARVYFAEVEGVIEGGLEEGVVEAAKELVEFCCTPEEGDAVWAAFCEG